MYKVRSIERRQVEFQAQEIVAWSVAEYDSTLEKYERYAEANAISLADEALKDCFVSFLTTQSFGLDDLHRINRALFAPFKANAPKMNGLLVAIGDQLFGHNRNPVNHSLLKLYVLINLARNRISIHISELYMLRI